MKYEVVWTSDAENDLVTAYLTASDPIAVTRASHAIDHALERHPLTFGKARSSSVNRVALVPPLGITFEVIEDDKRVFVQGVFASE